MPVITRDLLVIYLNDHLAGATVGGELARRAAAQNRGTAYGAFLRELAEEIEQDRAALEEVMEAVGAGTDRLKVGAAWLGEKAGRLKLNGRLTGYSPLSRVEELEGLTVGVAGKQLLWRSLRALDGADRPLPAKRLDELIRRAERQRKGLIEHHAEAAREAFAGRAEG
jgi:hypothetical protein